MSVTAEPASVGMPALAEVPAPAMDGPLLRARSRPPRLRPGLVARPRLVERLMGRGAPLALLIAPAGYGKTTLLAEWDQHDHRPFAWVSLDHDDNDPARLAAHIACALDPVEPVCEDVFEAVSEMTAVVLVLDDLQVLHEPVALAVVSAIGKLLRPESQLALASRTDPPLPTGRLRAEGQVAELGSSDLAMTGSEAATLFRRTAVDLRDHEVDALVERTEGWPAGLSLAALAAGKERDGRGVGWFAGDDRYVSDYIREAFLSDRGEHDLAFLRRVSVLERLSGASCDAVLGTTGSAEKLARLARSNLLLVPVGRGDEWYRYNRLLAEMLRAELHRLEPDAAVALHRRASDWFHDHGEAQDAVHHAVEAHDVRRAGELMWRSLSRGHAIGRNGTVPAWLARFTEEEMGGCPPLALVAAGTRLADGDGAGAEHLTSVAAGSVARAAPPNGQDLEAGIALLNASLAREGIARMAEHATIAHELEPDGSRWHPVCRLIQGAAAHLAGDRDLARSYLEHGVRSAAACAPQVHALCLTQAALLALDEDDLETGVWLVARARTVVLRGDLSDSPTSALVFAASAGVLAQHGQIEQATADQAQARKLLAGLRDFAPWYEAEARIALARAGLHLGDLASARALLAEASRILRQTPDAVVLREWLDEAWARADATDGSNGNGGWTLTTAELRVLQFLPSHLSFPDIAERLYVSPNTVKTHVRAVYRKLDASSRGQAVDRAGDLGLLISSPPAP